MNNIGNWITVTEETVVNMENNAPLEQEMSLQEWMEFLHENLTMREEDEDAH